MVMVTKIKKVLIAHQSTIPHYRVPFYNALEKRRPAQWTFDVVFDSSEIQKPIFFREPIDPTQFHFSTVPVRTFHFKAGEKIISYQPFFRKAMSYDLIVAENALNNLAYPLNQLHQLFGKKYALWGHGKDWKIQKFNLIKKLSEPAKLLLTRLADGFFAYTPRNKSYLIERGIPEEKIFVLYNTIDILDQRRVFERSINRRDIIRREMNLENKKVLLFVGRFNADKRIEFLLEAFSILRAIDANYFLLLVGSNANVYLNELVDKNNIDYLGTITDIDRLASIYSACDLFVLPGDVGLGPIQAFCYDLPTITIDSPTHAPEFEYLTPMNSIVMPSGTTPEKYALAINDLFTAEWKLAALRQNVWPSINHLTIDQMADNFIVGVDRILFKTNRK